MRIEQLTFTRFIAAILIVVFHYGRDTFLFNNEYISFVSRQANVGVSYFFVLSGFVMIIAYGNRKHISFLRFLQNRLARIYPVYLFAIILVLYVTINNDINFKDLSLNLTMIQSWFPEKAMTLNKPGWSLSVEFFFYILFPLLMNRLYSKTNFKTLTLWVVSFWVISQLIFHLFVFKIIELTFYDMQDIFYHPIMHFNTFLIGNLAGLFFLKYQKKYTKNFRLEILLLLRLLIIILKFSLGLNYHNGLLSIIFAPLIVLISFNHDRITKIVSHNLFVFLGEISYGIYILQFPIWAILSNYRMRKYFGVNHDENPLITFTVRLIILILIAGLSYNYFEKPLRNKIKRLRI
ncbi:MAG: acyltransferase [Algibacter sp.]|uniref:acyltransferase family protein n=1 Tax=Algibacter sp. TaxID=1872428 RepID=UPI00262E387C|nr:acyltransferase [Algibacter sp.]MDG1728690.1 acyltransferase [Algibacter sp.]MDG2178487.1 acyltransferase [Algibacter sp.]